jgi:hypothetical protein
MMFVHVWPGASKILATEVPGALHLFYFIIIREFGQASVPLLSIVSGYLFLRSSRTTRPADLVLNKARTLLVPMVVWSTILLAMYIVKESVVGNDQFFNVSAITWINRILAISDPPINLPLAFLRDIFVCCMIALACRTIGETRPEIGALLLASIGFGEYWFDGLLLLRPQILLFFSLGYCIAVFQIKSVILPWGIVGTAILLDVAIQGGVLADIEAGNGMVQLFHRLAMAMLIWRVVVAITRSDGPFYRALERQEKTIFLVFCSHMLTVSVLAAGFGVVGLSVADPIYPLIFVMQIPAIYLCAHLVNSLGEAASPRLMALASGRSLP